MKENEYQCASCKEIFEKGWSDKEADEEAEKFWTEEALKDTDLVCDDCFEQMMGTTVSEGML